MATSFTSKRTLILAIVVAVQVLALGAITARTARKYTSSHVPDWRIYQRYAEFVLAGELPYVSFAMEYPPGAIIPVALPRLVLPADASAFAYRTSLVVFNVFWSVLLTFVVARTARVMMGSSSSESSTRVSSSTPISSPTLESSPTPVSSPTPESSPTRESSPTPVWSTAPEASLRAPKSPTLASSAAVSTDRAEVRAAVTCAGLCVCLALILPFRFDIFPVLLSALALLCALERRPVACGWWLGLGIVCKIYPIVFLPIALIYFVRSDRRGAGWDAMKLGLMSVVPTAGFLLPYVLLGSTAYLSFLRYHTMRGLQIETLWSGIVMTAHRWGLTDAAVVHNFGAGHIRSPLADVLQFAQPIVAACALMTVVVVAWVQLNGRSSDAVRVRAFVRLSLLIVLTFILFNKVFSTQFIIWPVGLVALTPLIGRRRLVPVMFFVIVLTMYGFPINYLGLRMMEAPSVYALDVRNLLIFLMLVPLFFRSETRESN